jgi:hypothetical protein
MTDGILLAEAVQDHLITLLETDATPGESIEGRDY